MRTNSLLVVIVLIDLLLSSSCATSVSYWVPPASMPDQAATVSILSETAVQLLKASTTPQETQPPGSNEPDPTSTLISLPETEPRATGEEIENAPAVPTPTATPEIYVVNTAPILYYSQAADTLPVVAVRFAVSASEITSPDPIPETAFINPGQLLVIPRKLANTTSSQHLLPDSEVVNSPSAVGFDASDFAKQAGGYLNTFEEWHKSTGMKTGAEIIMRVAIENSINPRLLLALLEYHSGWVYGQPKTEQYKDYPLGRMAPTAKNLYNQLVWTVNQLSTGYYAYREGRLTEIRFKDGVTTRLAPDLNAGTAALQYYFAQLYDGEEWLDALDIELGFPALHQSMFGDPWKRAQTVEPLYPAGITQPALIMPFMREWTWSFTGGPHGAWEQEGSYAALDFAPGSNQSGCVKSNAWAVASASGLVARMGNGLVVIDLDGDGHEQTGWVLVYLHVEARDRIPLGSWVATGDAIGHPSCEGGFATGTHVHIARKFNGEWVPADGPLPFNLGGWVAHAGEEAYKGTMTRGGATITACTCSNYLSFITRTDDDP